MSCYISWNGKPSLLADQLTQKYGQEITDLTMSTIMSDWFVNKFGAYINTTVTSMPVDEQGKEPALEWVEKNVMVKPEHNFKSEDDALKVVEGYDAASDSFKGTGLKTGTLITIGGNLFSVVNDEDKDLAFNPLNFAAPQIEGPKVVPVPGAPATSNEIPLPDTELGKMGVLNIPNSGLSIEESNEFVDLLRPQIEAQAYIENKARTANHMASFGLRWARVVPNVGEKSKQGIVQEPRPDRVKINSKEGMTYGYFTTDQNNNPIPPLKELQPIINHLENVTGIDMSDYDSCLINIYDQNSFIHQHRDTTESVTAEKYPIIVLNLGADGHLEFDKNNSTYATYLKSGQLDLTNGGVYAFGVNGINRFAFHHRIGSGLESPTPTKPITLPGGKVLNEYRITLTFRRSQDLKAGMKTAPAYKGAAKGVETTSAKPAIPKPLTVKLEEPEGFAKGTRDTNMIAAKQSILEKIKLARENPATVYQLSTPSPYARKAIGNRDEAFGLTVFDYAELLVEIQTENKLPRNFQINPDIQALIHDELNRRNAKPLTNIAQLRMTDAQMTDELIRNTQIPVVDGQDNMLGKNDYVAKMLGHTYQQDTVQMIRTATFKQVLNSKENKVQLDKIIATTLMQLRKAVEDIKTDPRIPEEERVKLGFQARVAVNSFAFAGRIKNKEGKVVQEKDSRISFLSILIKDLRDMGLLIDENTENKLMNKFHKLKHTLEPANFGAETFDIDLEQAETQVEIDDEDGEDSGEVEGTSKALHWGQENATINPMDSLSYKLNMFLSNNIEMEDYVYSEDGQIIGTVPKLQESWKVLKAGKLVSASEIKSKLLALIGNRYNLTVPGMIKLIKDENDPTLWAIADKLEKNPQLSRQLFTAFNLKRNEYFMGRYVEGENMEGFSYANTYMVASGNSGGVYKIQNNWKQANIISESIIHNSDGSKRFNTEKGKADLEWIKKYGNLEKVFEESEYSKLTDALSKIFSRSKVIEAKEVALEKAYKDAADIMNSDGSSSPGLVDPEFEMELKKLRYNQDLAIAKAAELKAVTEKKVEEVLASYDMSDFKALFYDNYKMVPTTSGKYEFYGYPETRRTLIGEKLKDLFKTYGIDLSTATVQDITGWKRYVKKSTEEQEYGVLKDKKEVIHQDSIKDGFMNQFLFGVGGNPMGLFSDFFSVAANTLSKDKGSEVDEYDNTSYEAGLMENNPLHKALKTVYKLARLEQKNNPQIVDMFVNPEGKQQYSYSMHEEISKIGLELKENSEEMIMNLSNSILLAENPGEIGERDSYFLQQFHKNPQLIPSVDTDGGLRVGGGKKGKTKANMSDREIIINSLIMYANKNGNKDSAIYYGATASDKTRPTVFVNVPKISLSSFDGSISDEFVNAYYHSLQGEIRRVQHNEETNDRVFDYAKHLFFYFPFMNYTALLERDRALFYNEDKTLKPSVITTEAGRVKELLKDFLKAHVVNERKRIKAEVDYTNMHDRKAHVKFTKRLEELGVITDKEIADIRKNRMNKERQEEFDLWYEKKVKSLPTSKADSYTKVQGAKDWAKEFRNDKNEKLFNLYLMGFSLNSLLWQIESSMIYYGDVALTAKLPKDASFENVTMNSASIVEATWLEYTKRLAKTIAPFKQMDWSWKTDQSYFAITMSDVKESFDYLKALGVNVTQANGTDAQEFTTGQEHLDTLKTLGLIEDTKYDEFTQRILEKGDDVVFEDHEVLEMLQPMQPQKMVVSGTRSYEHRVIQKDYIKSSNYPLLPQFTKQFSEIDKVRKMMETHGIQRANYISAKKIGAPKNTLAVFDSEGKFTNPSAEDIKAATQLLLRKNLGVQQDVPYDPLKEEVGLVSQMNKLAFAGLDFLEGFEIGNTTMSGPELRKFKEKLRVMMADYAYEDFAEEILTDGELDPAKLMRYLREEAIRNGFSKNDIDLLKDDTESPLLFHPSFGKLKYNILSKLKQISQFTMPGKSYVQVSSTGYRGIRSDVDTSIKDSVITVGDYDGSSPLKHVRKVHSETGEEFKTEAEYQAAVKADKVKVLPSQVLAPWNFFIMENGKKKLANIEDFMLKEGDENYEPGKKKLNLDKVPKELIELIGARIPNQGPNSLFPIEIVGFVPTIMGDALFVPSAVTEQMGSDFDVDKLYTYKRPYEYDAFNGKFVPTKFSQDPENKLEIQRAYFEAHWAMANHKEVYDSMVSKLDLPYLNKNSAEENLNEFKVAIEGANHKYPPRERGLHYLAAMSQLDLYQSGKDAKALVGMTSLASTFNAVVENKELQLGGNIRLENGERKVVPKSILINGLELSSLSGYGKTGNYTKHKGHTLFQSAAVDNAKDRTIDNLNITKYTYPVIQMLVQLQTKDKLKDGKLEEAGKLLTPDFIIAMMVQPAMWEYSRKMRQETDMLTKGRKADSENKVLTELIESYQKRITKSSELINGEEVETTKYVKQLTLEYLDKAYNRELIGTAKEEDNVQELIEQQHLKVQLKVLQDFKELLAISKEFTKLQKTFNQDTNGAGTSLIYAKNQMEYMTENLQGERTITDNTKIIGKESLLQPGVEQFELFHKVIPAAEKIYRYIYPESLLDLISNLRDLQGVEVTDLPISTQETIVNSFKALHLSTEKNLVVDAVSENAIRQKLLYGEDSLAKRLLQWKRVNPINLFTFKLETVLGANESEPDLVMYDNKRVGFDEEGLEIQGFIEMLNSPDEATRNLAKDLVIYAFKVNPTGDAKSFINRLPSVITIGSQIGKDLASVFEQETLNDNEFEQIVQHNPELALNIGSISLSDSTVHRVNGEDGPIEFIIPSSKMLEEVQVRADNKDEPISATKSLTAPSKYLYYFDQKLGLDTLFKLDNETQGREIYYRIPTLGGTGVTEFASNPITDKYNSEQRSIFFRQNGLANKALTLSDNAVSNQLSLQIERSIDTENATPVERYQFPESGDFEALSNSLSLISTDKTLPAYYRSLAQVLNVNTDRQVLAQTPLTIGTSEMDDKGYYDTTARRIRMNPNQDKNSFVETLIHEVTHDKINELAVAAGYFKPIGYEFWAADKQAEYNAAVEKFNKANPVVALKFKELDRLRMEARNAFLQGKDETKLSAEEDRILYSLNSVVEFIPGTLTHKETMAFLNTVKTKTTKNWMEALIDKIKSFFSELGRFLGVPVDQHSVLAEAFSLAYGLTTNPNEIINFNAINEVIKTGTEEEALEMQYILEAYMNKDVTVHNEFTQYRLDVTKNITDALPYEIEKVAARMEGQVKSLLSLSRRVKKEDLAERERIARMVAEIRNDLYNLKKHKDIQEIKRIAFTQLAWAKDIISKSGLHFQYYTAANVLIQAWKDLDVLYEDEISRENEALNTLTGTIERMTKPAIHRLADFEKAIHRDMATRVGQGIKLLEEDFNKGLKVETVLATQVDALQRNPSRLIQTFSASVQTAAMNMDRELLYHAKRLRELETKFKALGNNKELQELFFQYNPKNREYGLTQRLSQSWFSNIYKGTSELHDKLAAPGTTLDAKVKAIDKFWKALEPYGEMLDLEKLIDVNTGEALTTPEATAAYEQMLAMCEDKDLLDATIEAAVTKYNSFLLQKSIEAARLDKTFEFREDTITNHLNAKPANTTDEEWLKEKRDTAIANLLKGWDYENNPLHFIKTKTDKYLAGKTKVTYTMPVLPKNGKGYDEKFLKIKDNPELLSIYTELKNMAELYQSYLPYSFMKRKYQNFIPLLSQGEVTEHQSLVSKFSRSGIHKFIRDTFYERPTEERKYDGGTRSIGTSRIGAIKSEANIKDAVLDIFQVMRTFGQTAVRHNHMTDMVDYADSVIRTLKQENSDRKVGELDALIKQVQAFSNTVIYGDGRKSEGHVKQMQSYNREGRNKGMTNAQVKDKIAELNAELEAVTKQIDDKELIREKKPKGDDTRPAEVIREEEIKQELEERKRDIRVLTMSKIGDAVITYTHLKAMSYNPFSAIANFGFNVMAINSYLSGYRSDAEDGSTTKGPTTKALWHQAKKLMRGNVLYSAGSIFNLSRTEQADKIKNVLDKFGFIDQLIDGEYGKKGLTPEERNYFKRNFDPLNWQKSGDFYGKGSLALAIMLNTKVEVMIDGVPTKVNIYDALNKEGNWDVEKYGERPEWYNPIDPKTETMWSALEGKIRAHNVRVFGNQDKFYRQQHKDNILGRLIGQFKSSWLTEGYKHRWGGYIPEDPFTGEEEFGRYRMMVKWATSGNGGTLLGILKNQLLSVVKKDINPFAATISETDESGNVTERELKEYEIINMRRNLAGMLQTIAVIGAYFILKSGFDDDEDKKRWARLMSNIMFRSYQDLSLYSNPFTLKQTVGSIVPASWTSVEDLSKAVTSLRYIADGKLDNNYETIYRKGLKAFPFTNLIPKTEWMMERSIATTTGR